MQTLGAAGRLAVEKSNVTQLAVPPHPMFAMFACLRFLFSAYAENTLQVCLCSSFRFHLEAEPKNHQTDARS